MKSAPEASIEDGGFNLLRPYEDIGEAPKVPAIADVLVALMIRGGPDETPPFMVSVNVEARDPDGNEIGAGDRVVMVEGGHPDLPNRTIIPVRIEFIAEQYGLYEIEVSLSEQTLKLPYLVTPMADPKPLNGAAP